MLEIFGIKADYAFSGKDALEIIHECKTRYDIILMDWNMPGLDGIETAQGIKDMCANFSRKGKCHTELPSTIVMIKELPRKENKEIPIIALTANAMKDDVEKTLSAGMNEHLNKPVDVEKFYAVLLKYIDKKNSSSEDNNVKNKNKIHKTCSNADLSEDSELIELPDFININTVTGLKHLAGNKKLYKKILNDFLNNYKTIKLGRFKNLQARDQRTA